VGGQVYHPMNIREAAYNLANNIKAQGVPARCLSVIVCNGTDIRVRLAGMHAGKVLPRTWEGYPVEVKPWAV
jgi:hypothetical protein